MSDADGPDAIERQEKLDRDRHERIAKLKEIARAGGYALAEHGTMKRDIDLICFPWVADCIEPLRMIEAIRAATGAIITDFELKPHGRIGVIMQGWGSTMWDISVFPPRAR